MISQLTIISFKYKTIWLAGQEMMLKKYWNMGATKISKKFLENSGDAGYQLWNQFFFTCSEDCILISRGIDNQVSKM